LQARERELDLEIASIDDDLQSIVPTEMTDAQWIERSTVLRSELLCEVDTIRPSIDEVEEGLSELATKLDSAKSALTSIAERFEASCYQVRRALITLRADVESLQGTEDWQVVEALASRRVVLEHSAIVEILSASRASSRMCTADGDLAVAPTLASECGDLVRRCVSRNLTITCICGT
jgi:hypothetical protein